MVNGGDVTADPSPPSSVSSILYNYVLISSLLAFLIAQAAKFFITRYREKHWDVKRLIGSGGMPSSHSATVAALAAATGLQEGFGESVFAATVVLACVVMYDARGVRLHAGRQAEVLNQIVYELPAEHPLADITPLRELLGHTFPQKGYTTILNKCDVVTNNRHNRHQTPSLSTSDLNIGFSFTRKPYYVYKIYHHHLLSKRNRFYYGFCPSEVFAGGVLGVATATTVQLIKNAITQA